MIERIEINLLPAEYRIHKRSIKIGREVAYPLIGLAILAVSLAFMSLYLQNSISGLKNEIAALDQQIQQNRPIQNEINRLRSDKIQIEEKIRALERINVNREKWVRLMEELAGRIPEYTWLVSVKEENSTPPVLHMEGRTYSFPEVANYMTSLKESEYVNSVDLSNIEQIDPKQKLYRFSISCVINPDVKLRDSSEPSSTLASGGRAR
ncbi:MAG: hypothetical protein GX089_15980 [Fibrobacter sp.]|jgi:Tfp pilus assembly protein PilN|nr:hypothetical protein [Fibrobacter sp.]